MVIIGKTPPDRQDQEKENVAAAVELWQNRREYSDEVLTARRAIAPQHLADLRRSGLSDSTVRSCGFYSVESGRRDDHGHSMPDDPVARILRWKGGGGTLGPCLAIPFFALDGTPTDLVRLKPDHPIPGSPNQNGSPRLRKYEQPRGVQYRPYFPPGILPLVNDPTQPLLITEGEKKAAKAVQEGIACVGLTGVECWSVPRTKGQPGRPSKIRPLLPELAALPLAGRIVGICYDSDLASKPDVQRAESALASELARWGADVHLIHLPAGENGAKVGLDDYLLTHSAAEFRSLPGWTEGGVGGGFGYASLINSGRVAKTDQKPPPTPPSIPEAPRATEEELRGMLRMEVAPPASACRRMPAVGMYRESDPKDRRIVRLACSRWGCLICRRRLADCWALHLALSAEAALAGGRLLWTLDAPDASRRKAIQTAVAHAVSRAGADYARVDAQSERHYLIACAEQPQISGEPAPAGDLSAACQTLGVWLASLGQELMVSRGRRYPIATSKRWKQPPPPKSDMKRDKELVLGCNELLPVLAVFIRFGVCPVRVRENWGNFAWRIDYRLPDNWFSDDVRDFQDMLHQVRDNAPQTDGPPLPEGEIPW